MKLKDVLKGVNAKVEGDENLEIKNLSHISSEENNDGIFFAIKGTKIDGNDYIEEAIKNGAKVIVTDQDITMPDITIVKTDDVRLAMSLCASNYYNNPSKDMLVIGVTGTNGKTTSTYMMASVLKAMGRKVGIIGTNGVFLEGRKIGGNLTTPDPIYLQKTLDYFRSKNVDAVCMEVSAHALDLEKTRGVMTDIALFTNLTQDHLDYFGDMETYFNAKQKLFNSGMTSYGVINYDDPYGRRLFEECDVPALVYSRSKNNPNFKDANIISANESHNTSNQSFEVYTPIGKIDIDLNLSGGFNISNALGVIGASILAGADLETIKKGLKNLEKVEGRFNCYDVNGVRVIIDYAHTPDGLENILKAAKEITSGKVISVFGCGGNRDSLKRPIMGEISDCLADYTFVTTDNPRFERPQDIAADIVKGIKNKPYTVELDREKAICKAIEMAKAGDSVVIAGKGAEPYIDRLGVKTPYEDRLVVEKIISELNK